MTSRERVQREAPERTSPRRSTDRFFRYGTGDGESANNSCPDGAAGGAWADQVARAVDLGYRVVDEQIRYGQRIAREFNDRAYGSGRTSSTGQDPTDRLLRQSGQLAAAWMDVFSRMASGPAAAWWGTPWMPPGGPWAAWQGTEKRADSSTPCAVETRSARPVKVTLTLCPGAECRRLALGPLRYEDTGDVDSGGVVLESAKGTCPVTVRVTVTPEQRAGERAGDILDEATREVLGRLVVHVKA